ncbi:MAG: PadR family transcriptional regulator [Oscillospiraceae bacterium]|jgi:DNA-binding PadR family transcriptional regulator|nr:PadR family transcriptional regulator [Oscillospiraceae bacterium]
MDKLILGLLMLKKLTVYEIKNIIKQSFKTVCSDSLGSIQAAIKKLLRTEMITYDEYVEKGVNKKRYSITEKGRNEFSAWLKIPADFGGSKTMESGKLLFMGLVPQEQRKHLIDGMIKNLEESLSYMTTLRIYIKENDGQETAIEYWKQNPEYYEGLKKVTHNKNMKQNAEAIFFFQVASLLQGIDTVKFHIQWLKSLKEKINNQNFNPIEEDII